jgi:hypothetical protein
MGVFYSGECGFLGRPWWFLRAAQQHLADLKNGLRQAKEHVEQSKQAIRDSRAQSAKLEGQIDAMSRDRDSN